MTKATAAVIGSGPNGLTAGIILAKAGIETIIYEAESLIGGGARSAESTHPGFIHDVCSAVYPLGIGSPAFASFPLAEHGLEWIQPKFPLAHPLDDGSCVSLDADLEAFAELQGFDGRVYRKIVQPFVAGWSGLVADALAPIHFPCRPLLFGAFGTLALSPAIHSARLLFRTEQMRALFAGLAAHSILPLSALGSSAFAWLLATAAHAVGWPIARGGAQSISNALASYFRSLGGQIVTNTRIKILDELNDPGFVLCDVTPQQFLTLAGAKLPDRFRAQLAAYRYGPGVFKMDWALREPIPWRAAACSEAGTIHLGGSFQEIVEAEAAPARGEIQNRPFVLLAQPSLFDSRRAPDGGHTAWGYCHVPNASRVDMAERIEAQIERFAPGFQKTILARRICTPADLERHNSNLVGGDISGGSNHVGQLFLRPTRSLYRTPLKNVYLCSASTPPGGGVHGMCGFHAARTALHDAGIGM